MTEVVVDFRTSGKKEGCLGGIYQVRDSRNGTELLAAEVRHEG